MDTNYMRQMLSAPVSLLRPSSEEERGLFHNRKGWFYTFGLETGPKFVAHIDKGKNIYTFRPLDNLVNPLIQFQWYATDTRYPGILPMFDVVCKTGPNASDGDSREFGRILGPKAEEYTEKAAFGFLKTKLVRYYYPDVFQKAYRLREGLLEREAKIQQLSETRREFREAEHKLQGLMIPNDSIDQITQNIINERRQKNG